MSKDIKKLKYPIWFTIVFYTLTIALPVILISTEAFKSPNSTFRFTFGFITGLFILWLFMYKFIIADKLENIRTKKSQLEHEYEIEVGNSENIKKLWFENEQILSIVNMITAILLGLILIVLSVGLSAGFMKIKFLSFSIAIAYVIAYFLRFLVISILKGGDTNEQQSEQE